MAEDYDSILVQQAWDADDFELSAKDYKEDAVTVNYIVSGTSDERDVLRKVGETVPRAFSRGDGGGEDVPDIPLDSISIAERLTETDWKVSAHYKYENSSGGFQSTLGGSDEDSSSDSDEEPTFNFEVTTGTKRMVYSRLTRHRYPADAPNNAGINDGEGVDTLLPVGRFSETHYMRSGKVTAAYRRKLIGMVGKINSRTFRGFKPQEVLFAGASGTRIGRARWQITFNFMVSLEESGITIGPFTGISKAGWDVIWTRYKDVSDTAKGEVVRTVKAVFVEQVYQAMDFAILGIPK